jgi:hypothetical protein
MVVTALPQQLQVQVLLEAVVVVVLWVQMERLLVLVALEVVEMGSTILVVKHLAR